MPNTHRILKSALAVALASTSLLASVGQASAEGGRYWQRNHRAQPHAAVPRHYPQHYGHEKRRDNTARNVALGIGAVILGAIIANETRRSGHTDRFDD